MSRPHEHIPLDQLYRQVVHDDELIVELLYRTYDQNHRILALLEQHALSPEDQALLDGVQARAEDLASRTKALDNSASASVK